MLFFFYQKYLFFCGSFVCWTYAVGGNNSKWSQPGEKPYNFCFPVCGQKCTMEREKVLIRAWIIWNDQNRNGKWNWRSFDHYFLAKLTLRCHIPPLLNVSPYSYNQFWCGASYLYGGVWCTEISPFCLVMSGRNNDNGIL